MWRKRSTSKTLYGCTRGIDCPYRTFIQNDFITFHTMENGLIAFVEENFLQNGYGSHRKVLYHGTPHEI